MSSPSSWRGLLLGSLCLASLTSPPDAHADWKSDADRNASRWIPAFAFHSGVIGLNAQAGVSSAERGYFQDDNRLVYPFVASGLEVSTPALSSGFGRPRIFFHGAAELSFDLDRSIVKEGDPGQVKIFFIDPDGPNGPAPPLFPAEDRVTGVGSQTSAQAQTLAATAGLGVSLAFPIGDRELRLKPSIEYRYDEFEVSTAMSDAESILGDGICPCRTVRISGNDTKTFHAVGPSLEVELDAQRAGSLMISVFLSAQGYYLLGDRTLRVTARGNFDTGDPASVVSTFKRSPWTFRTGVGFRARWLPE